MGVLLLLMQVWCVTVRFRVAIPNAFECSKENLYCRVHVVLNPRTCLWVGGSISCLGNSFKRDFASWGGRGFKGKGFGKSSRPV